MPLPRQLAGTEDTHPRRNQDMIVPPQPSMPTILAVQAQDEKQGREGKQTPHSRFDLWPIIRHRRVVDPDGIASFHRHHDKSRWEYRRRRRTLVVENGHDVRLIDQITHWCLVEGGEALSCSSWVRGRSLMACSGHLSQDLGCGARELTTTCIMSFAESCCFSCQGTW